MDTPGQRLEYYIKRIVEVSVPDFASMIDIEYKTIYQSIRNQTKSIIGRNTLKKINSVFPNFPWEWIKEGKGEIPGKETAERKPLKPELESESDCQECKEKDEEINRLKDNLIDCLMDYKILANELLEVYGIRTPDD